MTTTSTDRAPSPQNFKRPTGRLFVATLLVLTMGGGMWLRYQQQQQQRQLEDITEQLRALQRSPAIAPVPVEPRLTALEQKVAELERKPPPGPSPIQPPAPVPSPQPTPDPIPPPTPSSVEARLAKLEAEGVRLKSLDMPAFSKRLEASELKQNHLSGQLTGLSEVQKDAALDQDKTRKRQIDMQDQLDRIVRRIRD